MKCYLCSEDNVEPEHQNSEKHIKNQFLFKYSMHRNQLASNRKGVVVTCNVKTSFVNTADCADSEIKVSAKPNEEVQFNFIISNENKTETIYLSFVQIPENKMNFVMNDHNVGLGCIPVCLEHRKIFPTKIFVTFKSQHIGQYELPIIFSFCKTSGTKESIVIVRDMVVYVELKHAMHHTIISPYASKEVVADILIRTTANYHRAYNMFPIPKNCKQVFANNLNSTDKSSEQVQKLTADIKDVFETGVTEDNYIRFFHNLLWYEETITKIGYKKFNMCGVQLFVQQERPENFLKQNCFGLAVPGLGEKRPSLIVGSSLFVKPQATNEMMFEAVVYEIRENYVILNGLDGMFLEYYSSEARFDIRFVMSRMSMDRMHQAVHQVMSSGQVSRIFPARNQSIPELEPIKKYFNVLVQTNLEQCTAVRHILSQTSGTAPYLLHGPPGTGKTVTVVEAILQVVNQSCNHRIMVCTDSNMAADHVASVIVNYKIMFPIENFLLRANSKNRVWETLPERLHPYSNGKSVQTFEPVSEEDFLAHRIIVTTLSHAAKFAKQFAFLKKPISHLFIDEAAQASEPASLIPIVGLLQPRGALVLSGDPLQLGPVVLSYSARAKGLGLSLMERLKNTCPLYADDKMDPNYTVMLLKNFRSDPDILALPNELFYKGRLKALATKDALSNVDILDKKAKSRAIVFHGVLSQEEKMGSSPSFFNPMEIQIVQMYVRSLIVDHKVSQKDIGIVSPYIRQVYKIKTWLRKKGLTGVEVGTVEAFQGKEKRVMLVSTVRGTSSLLDTDDKFKLGFVADDKRFNVALTRAKAKVIVIGNPLSLRGDGAWAAYMQRCRRLGSYRGLEPDAHSTLQHLMHALSLDDM